MDTAVPHPVPLAASAQVAVIRGHWDIAAAATLAADPAVQMTTAVVVATPVARAGRVPQVAAPVACEAGVRVALAMEAPVSARAVGRAMVPEPVAQAMVTEAAPVTEAALAPVRQPAPAVRVTAAQAATQTARRAAVASAIP